MKGATPGRRSSRVSITRHAETPTSPGTERGGCDARSTLRDGEKQAVGSVVNVSHRAEHDLRIELKPDAANAAVFIEDKTPITRLSALPRTGEPVLGFDRAAQRNALRLGRQPPSKTSQWVHAGAHRKRFAVLKWRHPIKLCARTRAMDAGRQHAMSFNNRRPFFAPAHPPTEIPSVRLLVNQRHDGISKTLPASTRMRIAARAPPKARYLAQYALLCPFRQVPTVGFEQPKSSASP